MAEAQSGQSPARATARPSPKANTYVHTDPFWTGARAGKLMLQYCPESGRFQHPPRPVSIYTGKRRLEWREVSGKGAIYACSVLRVPGPGLEGRLPMCYASIDLDEGVRIIGTLLDCQSGQATIGARVKLAWDKLDDGMGYPAFVLTG